jgi:hypothetical protein
MWEMEVILEIIADFVFKEVWCQWQGNPNSKFVTVQKRKNVLIHIINFLWDSEVDNLVVSSYSYEMTIQVFKLASATLLLPHMPPPKQTSFHWYSSNIYAGLQAS